MGTVSRAPPSVQVASRTSVSDDMPLLSMPLCSTTSGSACSGSRLLSHPSSTSGTRAASRLLRCIFRSAGGGAWVTTVDSFVRTV